MKLSEEKIKQLFDNELMPKLQKVEKDRVFIKKRLFLLFFASIPLFVFPYFIRNEVLIWIVEVFWFFALAVLAVIVLIKYVQYRHHFKEVVVKELVHLINPQYQYDAYSHTNVFDFNKSTLFAKGERAVGDDLVKGKIDQTIFEFSEIKVGKGAQNSQNSKQSYFFRGLFFFADFNKTLNGNTFVAPDKAEKLLGKWAQSLQSKSGKGELVKLENAAFEKLFVVHSSSQVEARYILTPLMMESMVSIQKKFRLPMHFSFTGNRIHCAIPFNQNLFEPVIFGKGLKFKDVLFYSHLLNLIETLIEEMNLNTHIWAKN